MGTSFQIAKLDDEQCIVFGFANVSIAKTTAHGVGGHEIEDLQLDHVPPDELEKAAYVHVLESREADAMHTGPAIGHIVESLVFTPDKLEKFATDPVTGEVNPGDLEVLKRLFPTRWWVGYKVDKAVFAKVKSGEYKMFSIAGTADREDL